MTPSKTTPEFERMYKVLNKAQKKAVDSIDGPVMVIAGPGTGKTTLLTLRIVNILRKTDAAPENILAMTFTESGAYNMRRKLFEVIGKPAYKVNIHTFHGFAERIIQEFPDYFPRIIGSSIIAEPEQIRIIEKIVSSRRIKVLRPYGDPHYYVRAILGELHLLKRENILPKKLLDSINQLHNSHALSFGRTQGLRQSEEPLSRAETERTGKRDEKNRELAFVYAEYEKALAKGKYYDFDDMLLEVIRALERNEDFKLMLQEQYQYILADEHQDANASQNRILELLSDHFESPNLFIVGDDRQAIYRFQGASLENFLYFSNKYKNAVVVELQHNYRSHQGILDSSHSMIANNPSINGRPRSRLISLQVGTKPIYVDEFGTSKEELQYLAVLIQRLIKKGEKPEEIAVLYRENKESASVAQALRAYGIPTSAESEDDVLNERDNIKIITICEAISDLSDSEHLARALLVPELGCDPAEVSEISRRSRFEKKPIYRLIQTEERDYPSLKKVYSKMAEFARNSELLPFQDLVQMIIRESGLMASILQSADSLPRFVALETLLDSVQYISKTTFRSSGDFYLKDFMNHMSTARNHGIVSKSRREGKPAGVRMMTAHRAKGLEFNHVFIVNAVDGVWGNRFKRNLFRVPVIEHAVDSGLPEDERRLFYVAMTRARESVNIFYSRSNGDKETMPTQFISEIDPAYVSFGKPIVSNPHDLFIRKLGQDKDAGVSVLDPEFVKSRFLSRPFSATNLNNYLECPWKYFFTGIICIPENRRKQEMYGTAVHAALKSFFEILKEGRNPDLKRLIELFKHFLDLQPMSVDDRRESLSKGKEALKGYYRAYAAEWNRRVLTEYDIRGIELDFTGPCGRRLSVELAGKIDKMELVGARDVVVVDYKTAKPMSRNEIEGRTRASDGNYKRQLVFYALLIEISKKFNMKRGEIDFIEPNDRGKYKKEIFEIAPEEIVELKKLIQETALNILGMSFIGKTCDDKDCEYCRLGKMLVK